MTFWGEMEHFSGKNGELNWSFLVREQKYNVKCLKLTVPVASRNLCKMDVTKTENVELRTYGKMKNEIKAGMWK